MAAKISAENLDPDLKDLLIQVLADMTAMRTAYALALAKLDADAGVTDTNYAATCSPAAATVSA